MGEKKPDDIMAECLLSGGKMLRKACRACGSPLFEVKGKTLCVVCAAKGREATKEREKPATPARPAMAGPGNAAGGGETDPAAELLVAIAVLARRARDEPDPERCRALMEAARNGALALSFLQR